MLPEPNRDTGRLRIPIRYHRRYTSLVLIRVRCLLLVIDTALKRKDSQAWIPAFWITNLASILPDESAWLESFDPSVTVRHRFKSLLSLQECSL